MVTSSSVPVIDMQEILGKPQLLVKALQEWGCFRLINHGIPTTLMSEMKTTVLSLFDLPLEIKQRNVYSERLMGYIPRNAVNSLYEALGVYGSIMPDSIDQFCAELDASAHQREILLKYSKAVDALAHELGRKIMEGFGLVGDLFRGWSCHLRMNKYHCSSETLGMTGIPLHSDQGFLTIVFDDETINGLQIIDEKTGECLPVNPLPGSFLVNAGDIAKVWSDGTICNVKHRVQSVQPKARVSIAYFILGPRETKVEAPPELVDSGNHRRYIPLDFEEYSELRLSKSVTGGALDFYLQENENCRR